MINIDSLCEYLNVLLHPELFSDYCPNGLQVSGKKEIERLVTGVTASQALIDAAIEVGADAILVHHGFFWKGENPCITGYKRDRLAALIKNNVNLIAYHLPLDAHHEFGNNVQLARLLGLSDIDHFSAGEQPALGCYGVLTKPCDGDQFALHIETQLQRRPLHIPGKAREIKHVAWCTGAAQDFIDAAAAHNVDAFITGEVSERTVHIARETGLHFYAAGHHATERYGVQSLGEHLAKEFKLQHEFIDIDNPV